MSSVAASTSRRTWVWAGLLLVSGVVLRLLRTTTAMTLADPVVAAVIGWSGDAVFAASMLLFAFGWKRQGSVVAGRLPGIIALIVLAGWPFVALVPAAVYTSQARDLAVAVQYAVLAVWLIAAVVAVVEIARAGVVPRPWSSMPAIGLAVYAGLWVVIEVTFIATGPSFVGGWYGVLASLSEVVAILVPLLLGILALALGLQRPAPASVEILSSRAEEH
jgi:hypothetical protein